MKTLTKGVIAAIVAYGWLAGVAVAGEQHPIASDVESFVAELGKLGIEPGLAITIVSGDEVLLDATFGTADAASGRAATEETRFYLASSTKSFTALAVALLAHEEQLDLASPLSKFFPDVELAEPLSSDAITLRDLLSHTSGLSNRPTGWRTAYTGEYDHDLLVSLIDDSAPLETGKAFAYTNYGYVLTSLILEEQFEQDWKKIVHDKVLRPAGMKATTAHPSKIADKHKARPHAWAGGSNRLALEKSDAMMHAGGGHYTTSGDMARWLRLQLHDGVLDGRRVFPEGVVASTHVPIAEVDEKFHTYHRTGYGLGWYIADYEGGTMLHHFGSYVGARAHVSFLPKHDIGVAVLMNDASPVTMHLPDMLANIVYDRVLDLSSAAKNRAASLSRLEAGTKRFRGMPPPGSGGPPVDNPAQFAGRFHSPAMGTVGMAVEDGKLIARMGPLSSLVTRYRDTDSLRWELIPLRGQIVEVVEAEDGSIAALTFNGSEFKRQP